MSSIQLPIVRPSQPPWNKNRLIGQKRPLLPRQVWAIRARLELAGNPRNLVLFNLAIDSKLRSCDLVRLKVADLVVAGAVRDRVSIVQSKTGRPVQFEVSEAREDRFLSGSDRPPCLVASSSFQAGSTVHRTFRLGNKHVSCAAGCRSSDWILVGTERILFGGQKLR